MRLDTTDIMVSLKERVPSSARGPVSVGSLLVGVAGFTVGYILLVLGISFIYDLAPHELPLFDGLVITGIGVALLVAGYAGLKGFMYFSY